MNDHTERQRQRVHRARQAVPVTEQVRQAATAALAAALVDVLGDDGPLLSPDHLSLIAERVLDAVERSCEARGVELAVDLVDGHVRDYQRFVIAPYTAAAADDPEIAARLDLHEQYFQGLNAAAQAVGLLLATRAPLPDQPLPDLAEPGLAGPDLNEPAASWAAR